MVSNLGCAVIGCVAYRNVASRCCRYVDVVVARAAANDDPAVYEPSDRRSVEGHHVPDEETVSLRKKLGVHFRLTPPLFDAQIDQVATDLALEQPAIIVEGIGAVNKVLHAREDSNRSVADRPK